MARAGDLMLAAWISMAVAMGLLAFWMAKRAAVERRLRLKERMLRDELEAYAALDPVPAPNELPRAMAKRVCAAVVRYSSFRQVVMLMRDAESRLNIVGSAGVDDLMAQAINARVARFARERRHDVPVSERRKSCPVTLEPMEALDTVTPGGQRKGRQALILPLWSQAGDILGALAVWRPVADEGEASERDLVPLEGLAQKLARAVDIAQMRDRLSHAEKMAGLGNLAKGLAHELNNPLTAVLGFGELIVETASEPRVREDAVAIVGEAMRMRDTLDTLFQFWQPSMSSETAVDVVAMLRGLVERLEPELLQNDIHLVMQLNDYGDACSVRGDEKSLLEVFERLLNNAVHAVTIYKDEWRSIRVSLTCERERIRVVVTDSGSGFADAGRVFDPFYTTRQPGDGQGLGLAVSYGIVREHGGDISASNVYPHGASVVVELPLARVVKEVAERVDVKA